MFLAVLSPRYSLTTLITALTTVTALSFLALTLLAQPAFAQNPANRADNQASPQRTGLRITGKIDNGLSMIPTLKFAYATCVMKQQAAQAAVASGPIGKSAVARSRPKKYSITANPEPEPDWDGEDGARLGNGRFEEYFSGDRYAKYEFRTTHDFSTDGKCRLQTHHTVDIELDDGQSRYSIAMRGKKNVGHAPGTSRSTLPSRNNWTAGSVRVTRKNSALEQEAREDLNELRQLVEENPEGMAALLGMLLGNSNASRVPEGSAGGTGNTSGTSTGSTSENTRAIQPPAVSPLPGIAAINELKSALQYSTEQFSENGNPSNADDEVVAGQPCDKVKVGLLKSRACYWHRMHYYLTPSGQRRPIVLLSESGFTRRGERAQISYRAESFNWGVDIDNAVFRPGPGLNRPGDWSE